MKIEKIMKLTGIAIFIGAFIFIFYTFVKDLNWIIASKDFSIILNYVFTLMQITLLSLFIYGFGEMISVLSDINRKL